jgi:GT2 family glycosyltransferase
MRNNKKPRVLVVIPTLGDRLEYLKQALESISIQNVPYDISVSYPLKNKKAAALLDKFNVIHVDDPGTMSGALNAAIAAAKPWHEYIVWIGDDDLLYPDSLATSMAKLDKNPSASVAFGYCDYINENGEKIFSSKAGSLAPWIMTWGPDLVPMMGLMMRKSSLDKVGLFNVELKWAMDLDMLLRLKSVGSFINTKRTLSAFRWHSTSQTVTSRPKVLDETERIKRIYLPVYIRPFAFLWEKPVRIATKVAVSRVNAKTRTLNG